MSVLDRISPYEAHLPPSERTWARVVRVGGWDVLELRDPNSGQGSDPSSKPRHQYAVSMGVLYARRLPPAPLSVTDDEMPWVDDPLAARWRPCTASPDSPVWEWAGLRPQTRRDAEPWPLTVEADLHGDGGGRYQAWAMPPADLHDRWASITGVPCPVPGCDQTLVWYEAGYVPGYRVCMAALDGERYDADSIRHRFCLLHSSPEQASGRMVLVLEQRKEPK